MEHTKVDMNRYLGTHSLIVPLLMILGILYVRVSFGEECLPQLEHFFLILIHTTVFVHTTERLRVKHLVLNWENWFPAMEFRLYSLIMRYFNLYLFLGVLQAEPRGGQWGHANKETNIPAIHQLKGSELGGLLFGCSVGRVLHR